MCRRDFILKGIGHLGESLGGDQDIAKSVRPKVLTFFHLFSWTKTCFSNTLEWPNKHVCQKWYFRSFLDPPKKVRTFCHVGEVSNIQKIMNFKKNVFFHCFNNIYYSGFQFFNFWKLWKYEFRHRSVDRFSRKQWFSVDETFRFVKNRLLGAHQMKSFLWFLVSQT